MKRYSVLVIFCVSSIVAHAQFTRYLIQLKDKNGTQFTLANPGAYLSARSVERRKTQKISIDSTDLPVLAAYLDSIRMVANVTILNNSKWLNQVLVRTSDATALAKINSFPFVRKIESIAARMQGSPPGVYSKIEQTYPYTFKVNSETKASANTINYGNTLGQIHIHTGEYLHNLGFTGDGRVIAILDAGFFGYKTNSAFDSVRVQNGILGEWDFVDNQQSVNEDDSHGMHCFSIMAANRPGLMVGSVPKAKFYLFRTEDVSSEYPVEEQNWAAGAERADSLGADMISSSLGYSDFDNHALDHSYAQRNGNTSIITMAADLAAKKGMIIMSSAGNSGNETSDLKFVDCPADGDSVVAVGAVDINGKIAGFSSWGPNGAGKRKPNIVSVGQGTITAGLDGNPESGNGTSYSNPNIAGLIACFWQAFPEFSNMDIIDAVQKSADRFSNPDYRYGYGIPDFKKAFSILVQQSFKGSLSNNKCVTSFTWTGKDNQGMRYDIERKTGSDSGFIRVGSINGKFTAFTQNSYSFSDSLKSLSATAARYRIRQSLPDTSVVLMDSTVNILEPCTPDNQFIISPNPFTSTIGITINTGEAIEKLSIGLYNMQGQRLYYYEGSKTNGTFTYTIPAYGLPAGGYVITIRDKRRIILSKKVIK